jgi:hypothetical protein
VRGRSSRHLDSEGGGAATASFFFLRRRGRLAGRRLRGRYAREQVATGDQSRLDRGTLLLADITGYTAFLQAVGAAHAADMAAGTFVPKAYPLLTTLIDGIVEQVSPPFVLSKLEGDAVFAFGPDGTLNVRGQAVLDCLSACYEAYRARLGEAKDV